MLPAASRVVSPRTQVAPHAISHSHLAAQRVAGRRTIQRFQSTAAGQSSSSTGSHVAAGVAGGATVILAGYAWYHFSGAKAAVNTARQAKAYYEETKRIIAERAPKNPNEVIEFLRKTAKSYVGIVPGASSYIDSTFDALDELHSTHREEVEKILNQGYDEVKAILKDKNSGADMQTGMKVMGVLGQRMNELQEVGRRAGSDVIQKLGERHPELKEQLGEKYEQLRKAAEKNGPEAKRIFDETTHQIKGIFSSGLSSDKLNQVRDLIQSGNSQIRSFEGGVSQDAWDQAVEEATPYLDKLPDVWKLIEDNASVLMAAGLSQGSAAQEVLARVKEAAESNVTKDKQKLQELKEFVQERVDDAGQLRGKGFQHGWHTLREWIGSMPGGKEALKKVPDVDVDALMAITQSRSDDAKKLTGETYEEVLKVLQEKATKARELARETKEDVKRK